MLRVTLSDSGSVRMSSQYWRLVVAVCLLAGCATSKPMQCSCWSESYTERCVACTQLPVSLPAGVSSLNMTGNLVSHIHLAANVLSDLKSLYLNKNIIRFLKSGDLCPLKSLFVLDLSDNDLESVEEKSIACNDQLKRLVLNDNPRLQLVALRSQSLEDLYLDNCGLTSFHHSLLRQLPALRALYLRGNDLPCAQIAQDLRKHRPHLNVYCDVKTTATKNNTATISSNSNARANNPNKSTMSSDKEYVSRSGIGDATIDGTPIQTPVSIQIVAPIPIVPLIAISIVFIFAILAFVLVAVIFRRCQQRGHDSRPRYEAEEGKPLGEPC